MNRQAKYIEVCFSPELFQHFFKEDRIVVIADILRATSAICTAFHNGVNKIIPVDDLEEARQYKKDGYVVAAERDGQVLDFADFGNSPFNFTRESVGGKTIVYSTTNGTRAMKMAQKCYKTVIGSFINLNAVCEWLIKNEKDVIVLCAGWKGKFNLEDSVYAGAVVEYLIKSDKFQTICDSALASKDLWSLAREDIVGYIDKAAQRHRLRRLNLDDVIEYAHTPNSSDVIPVIENGYIINLK